jgi:hypothetical protein
MPWKGGNIVPIKWSALKVSEAAGMIEEFLNQAAEPLEQARNVAKEALKLPNLPQYIGQDLTRIIGEVDRAIGGSQFEPVGRIRAGIKAIRDDIPSGAVEQDQVSQKYGSTQALV